MRINPERLETDHFHRRVSGRITFCHLFSLSEPVGAKSGQIELKTQNGIYSPRDRSVSSTESLVWAPAPIGIENQHPRACFSRLPRVRPGGEAGRPVSKSILIGASIPYAERLSAGFPGGTRPVCEVLLCYLAQDTHTRCLECLVDCRRIGVLSSRRSQN